MTPASLCIEDLRPSSDNSGYPGNSDYSDDSANSDMKSTCDGDLLHALMFYEGDLLHASMFGLGIDTGYSGNSDYKLISCDAKLRLQ